MDEGEWLAEQFEARRGYLRGVAYRILGSPGEADDAVQEAWLRLSHSDTGDIHNLGGWLTTVVARVCLDMLRRRKSRREGPLESGAFEPAVPGEEGSDPEGEALLADSLGLALLVVLEALSPAERVAFVLHDLFAMPFDEIAPIVGRSPAAARQLASRARRRVQGAAALPGAALPGDDLARQRQVVDAFLAASRRGDLAALLAVLDPDVVVRADEAAAPPGAAREVRGAQAAAEQALSYARRLARFARPALVNGALGAVVAPHGRTSVVLVFRFRERKIAAIEVLAEPQRLQKLELAVL